MTSSLFNFFLLSFASFLLLNFLLAEGTNKIKFNPKKCTNDLEKTIYSPKTCAYQYLDKIRKKFLVQSRLIFTPLAGSFIENFQIKNGVSVAVTDAMGNLIVFTPTGTEIIETSAQYLDILKAYINFPGFYRQNVDRNLATGFSFSFVIYSINAVMYTITLSIPLSQEPICC